MRAKRCVEGDRERCVRASDHVIQWRERSRDSRLAAAVVVVVVAAAAAAAREVRLMTSRLPLRLTSRAASSTSLRETPDPRPSTPRSCWFHLPSGAW